MGKSEAARSFGVTLSSVKCYVAKANHGSSLRGLLGKAEARIREALVEAMDRAISAVNPTDGEGFSEHRGYRLPARQL
jgi:hypothetical protein